MANGSHPPKPKPQRHSHEGVKPVPKSPRKQGPKAVEK